MLPNSYMGIAPDDILYGLIWRQVSGRDHHASRGRHRGCHTQPGAVYVRRTGHRRRHRRHREALIEHWTGPWWIRSAGVLIGGARRRGRDVDTVLAPRYHARRVVIGAAAALFLAAMFTDADYFAPIRIVTGPSG